MAHENKELSKQPDSEDNVLRINARSKVDQAEYEIKIHEKHLQDQEHWYTVASERLDEARKEEAEAIKVHEDALKGKIDESKIRPEDIAASKGRMLGYTLEFSLSKRLC